MSQTGTSKFTWAVLIVILSMVVWFAWEMFGLHVEEPRGPVSASKAQSFAAIRIPAEATNIRIAGFRQWIQYQQFVRFEAPNAVCLRTATEIVPGEKLVAVSSDELAHVSGPVRKGVFHDFSWFDLRKATNVVEAGGGPSKPRVWVDQDRGIFYYCKGD